MITIAFDVDGTLMKKSPSGRDVPRYEIVHLLSHFSILGFKIYVWSGSGIDYAGQWVEKLGLEGIANITIVVKGSFTPDIAIDDENVELGIVNLKV